MLRVLAGVFFELKQMGAGDQGVIAFFDKLSSHMVSPVTAGAPSGELWLSVTSQKDGADHPVFVDGGAAPSARAQDVKVLVEAVTSWSSNPPEEL